MMRRFAAIAVACTMLAACGDSWLGDSAPAPLPGKRISVLSQAKSLEIDASGGPIVLPAPEHVADWPEVGGYPPHAMYHLALPGPVEHVWTADVGTGGDKRHAFLTQPVVAGGKVFAMDAEAVVSAFDLKDGKRLWRSDMAPEDADGGSFGGGIAFDDGRLFATTGFGEVLAVDEKDGHVLWRKSLTAPSRGAPTARAGRVLVVTIENETLALSAEDGHQLWRHSGIAEPAALMGGTSPAVDGNTVLAPYTSGELFALRVENGTVLWSDVVSSIRRTDQVAELSDIRGLPVVDRGHVYAVGNSDVFVAIDLRTGRRLWDRAVGSVQTPWVAGDFIFVVSNRPELICIDARNGHARWVTTLPEWTDEEDKKGRIVWTGPVLASDRLIVASSSGKALSVSPYTGAILSEEELPDGVTIPPVVASDTLLFTTEAGDLLAYR